MKRRTPSLGSLPNVAAMTVIDGPTPSNLNKPASSSLYHTCRSVLDRLAAVPGFEFYLESENLPPLQPVQSPTTNEPVTPSLGNPLTKLWQICRQGTSLCLLFNTLKPDKQIKMPDNPSLSNANVAKAAVYHFIVACKQELGKMDDELFTISDLTLNDTNGFVKVRHGPFFILFSGLPGIPITGVQFNFIGGLIIGGEGQSCVYICV